MRRNDLDDDDVRTPPKHFVDPVRYAWDALKAHRDAKLREIDAQFVRGRRDVREVV